MNDKFDQPAKGLAQSFTRRGALKKFGIGLAGGSGSWWAEPNRGEARLFGKRVLLVVEGKEAIGGHLDGDGHMKQAVHFLSERRKATPSNFYALGSPTARFSASCLVIRGRALWGLRSLARPLAVDTAVFMRRQLCRQSRSTSRRTCRPNRPRS